MMVLVYDMVFNIGSNRTKVDGIIGTKMLKQNQGYVPFKVICYYDIKQVQLHSSTFASCKIKNKSTCFIRVDCKLRDSNI